MNHDPTSRPASPPPSRRDDDDERQGGHEDSTRSSSDSSQKRRAGLAKKLQFMSHLMQSLDKLVFAELCTLYYMECSFPRLLLRTIPHYFFLTPKSDDVLLLLPAHRAHVLAIFIPNLVCMLLHLVLSLPHASEASRGYLHGGVIVDFVGQTPPSSRLVPLLLDLAIVALQCLMLAIHQEREKLRTHLLPSSRRGRTSNVASIPELSLPPAITQDHDAEERGVLRDGTTVGETQDMELQPLSDSRAEDAEDSRRPATPDLMGVLRSGNAILGDFYVVNAVRTASSEYQNTTTDSLSISYTATLAAMAAERRARLQARRR